MAIVDTSIRRLRTVLESRRQAFSYSVLPLASRFLKITILLVTIAAILSAWGYDTTTILAGLGVGGLAIALAAQKTIENLFGGVAVITDRPVAVGDFCKFGDLVGTVEDVGLRSTRIRTLGRTVVTVPNAEYSTMTLENFSKRESAAGHSARPSPEFASVDFACAERTSPGRNRRLAGAFHRRRDLFIRPGSFCLCSDPELR